MIVCSLGSLTRQAGKCGSGSSSRIALDAVTVFKNQRSRERAVYRLACPPVRAFSHPRVKAASTLIYDIELIEIMEVSR